MGLMSELLYFLTTHEVNVSVEKYTTAISTLGLNEWIRASPNPFKDYFYLEYNFIENYSVNLDIIQAATGKTVLTEKVVKNKTNINTGNLASGMYFLKLIRKDKMEYFVKKVMKY